MITITLNCPDNPFFQSIKPDFESIHPSLALIDQDDNKKFLIYMESHKASNPEIYSFLNSQIRFMAFGADSMNTCSSVLMYVKDDGNLLKKLESEFGNYTSSFALNGNLADTASTKVSYESLAWKKNNWTMLVSFQDSANALSEKQNAGYSRIWLKKSSNE
ncbi:MAG: hypothetical protein ACK5RG_10080 [Cyclobacteriaceae bacterium]|jgi:hypothetical protein